MKVGSEQSTDLGSLLEDEGIQPEEYATRNLLKGDIQKLLSTLNEQQQSVISMRYGLHNGGSKMTLDQIGKRMDISRERVRQVERAAIRKLRQRSQPLREYAIAG